MAATDGSEAGGTPDHRERLHRIASRLEEAQAAGATVDYAALAAELGISLEEFKDCAKTLGKVSTEPLLASDVHMSDPPRLFAEAPRLPDGYELLGEIGRGGMGIVYRVRQLSLDRIVALKVLRPGDAMFGDAVRRFEREAQSLARLRHPHIVSIHEVGKAGVNVFYVMDFIEGASLEELIRERRVTVSRAVRILKQVANAVAYTHSHGLIHRDLKPANILLDEAGNAFVVDFGLARDLGVERGLTHSGCVLGTPSYMSPEQARGDSGRIGEATDIYALGAILYECLTHRPPFGGLALAEVIHAVIHEEPKRPSHLNSAVPRDLEVICLHAMAKDPARRYPTARALLEDLTRFEVGKPIEAQPPSRSYRTARALRRNARLGLAGIILAAFAAILTGLVLRPFRGMTPEDFVVAAEDFHAQGRHDEARLFFEQAKERGEWLVGRVVKGEWVPGAVTAPARGDETVERLYAGWARCSREAAVLLREKGRPGEAADHLRRAVAEASAFYGSECSGGYGALLMELACTEGQLGDPTAARKALTSLRQTLEAWGAAKASGAAGPLPPDIGREAAFRVADDLLPKLLDAGDPCHEAAALYVLGILESAQYDPLPVARALEERGSQSSVALLVAAVRSLRSEMGAPFLQDMYLALGKVLIELHGPGFDEGLEPALARAAAHSESTPLARALCSSLLALRADLPAPSLAGRTELDVSLFADDAVLRLWQSLDDGKLSTAERYRRKVEAAVLASGAAWPDIGAWLEDHTGHDPRHGGEREATGWRDWWDAHGAEDPRIWLCGSLGLGLDLERLDLGELVRGFASGGSRRERVRRHHLLELAMDAAAIPPVWPSAFDGEPPGLAMRWVRIAEAAGKTVFAGPHVLRVAYFQVDPCGLTPRLLWQAARDIRVGEAIALEAKLPSSDSGSEPPGIHWSFGPAPPFTLQARLRLILDERGLVLAADDSESVAGMVLPIQTPHDAGSSHGPLLLAHVDAPGSGKEPWSLRDWELEIARTLELLFRALRDSDDHRHTLSLSLLPRVAAVWPLPEARGALRALHEARRTRQDGRDDFLPGRVLAGDESVLALDGLARTLDELAPRARLDPAYWAHSFLAAGGGGLRDLAASRLEAGDIPSAIGFELHSALERAGPEVSAGLVERVRTARARFIREEAMEAMPFLVTWVLWLAATIVSGFLGLSRRRPMEKRLRPAVVSILCGLLTPPIYVYGRGIIAAFAVLPAAVGALSGFIGSLVLARATPGGVWRLVTAAGFLAVLVITIPLAMDIDGGYFPLTRVAYLGYATALLGLAPLAYAMARDRPAAARGFRPGDAWISGTLVFIFCCLPAALPLSVIENLDEIVKFAIGLFGFGSVLMVLRDLWRVTAPGSPRSRTPSGSPPPG